MKLEEIELFEVLPSDERSLHLVEVWMTEDSAGRAEFGGFYSASRHRLAPLLDLDGRRFFLIRSAGVPVGFLDTDRVENEIAVTYFVIERERGHGIAARALAAFYSMNTDARATCMVASVAPGNPASSATAARAGFRARGTNLFGEVEWIYPLTGS